MNRIVTWFASNGIASNLLMALILVGGAATVPRLKQEVFPELSSDRIQIRVEYLGAAPDEVEEGVCQRVEEAIYGLAGIKRITSTAREGLGSVDVELLPGVDAGRILNDVKTRVDGIDTFPAETEKPIVEEVVLRRQVIEVAVSGNTDERSLRVVAERVRDDLAALPEISVVDLAGARPYEISIEVAEETLRRHGLTFDDLARAIRRSSLDLPGGSVKTDGGEILIRTKGQAYREDEFAQITVLSRADGTRLRIGEIARVIDGFRDTDQASRFDGERTVLVQVFRVGDQGALDIADAVHDYVKSAQHRVPEGISLTTWQDDSAVLRSRLGLLVENGLVGLALVCLSLALFLRLSLALWVAWGIPLSFLGAIWLLPSLDVSVNLISLFAFIVVLGLVVDDAIIVAESIYSELRSGKPPLRAAIDGARSVTAPVCFAVLTSVAAFSPLLGVPGNMGQVMAVIPAIVIATLAFSLVESLLILPAHLSHLRAEGDGERAGILRLPRRWWGSFQGVFARGLERFVERAYSPFLDICLRWRYLALAFGLSLLIVTLAFVAGGRIVYVFFPSADADNVVAFVTMPQGTPARTTLDVLARLEAAAEDVRFELESEASPGEGVAAAATAPGAARRPLFRHMLSSVGSQPFREAQSLRRGRGVVLSGGHLGEVNVELVPAEERDVTATEIARRWRKRTGPIADAVELSFSSSLFSVGEAINIQLASADAAQLRAASAELKEALASYDGVTDIADSFRAGKEEVKLALRPDAETLGLSLADLARQVRQGFYGEEAQRIQRGRDDVRVMVRYPDEERRSLGDLESMRIRTAGGAEVDFADVATVRYGRGYSSIDRVDRRRIIQVTADVDLTKANSTEIVNKVREEVLPRLEREYPGLSYSLEGEQREQAETFGGLARGLAVALVLIYALLAIPFRSYAQPLIVMSAIPFGVVGVVWGHALMGLPLTFLSLFGLVALTGVVVNDSLIMVDFINRARESEKSLPQAVRQAGARRFRPILLTSVTTFVGLAPLLLERSMQAQFLKPMAASLGFGVLFATGVTLILVPSGYIVLDDLQRLLRGRETSRGASPSA